MMFSRFEHWLDRIRRELRERRLRAWGESRPDRSGETRLACYCELRKLVAFSERARQHATDWFWGAMPYVITAIALVLLAAPRAIVIVAALAIPSVVLNLFIRVGSRLIGD